MVDLQDFIYCELNENLHLDPSRQQIIMEHLKQIPQIEPAKVQELSVLLFMAVGFMNNVSAENNLLEEERSDLLQGQINTYIAQVKNHPETIQYPFRKEQALLQAIAQQDIELACLHLKELLAMLFAQSGGTMHWIQTKAKELITLISRTAIEHGAEEEHTLLWLDYCSKTIPSKNDFAVFSAWFYHTVTSFLHGLFDYPNAKHANLIHKCIQHITRNYSECLTLEDTAKALSHSPDYLSRIFKQETGVTFNHYLNTVRIEKAKELMRQTELRLTDISHMVGYVDQSYFTKVFRKITGNTPNEYRKRKRKEYTKKTLI